MLTSAGFAQVDASNALAAFNFGGVGGAILGALVSNGWVPVSHCLACRPLPSRARSR